MITQVVFVVGSKTEQNNKEWSNYNNKRSQLILQSSMTLSTDPKMKSQLSIQNDEFFFQEQLPNSYTS